MWKYKQLQLCENKNTKKKRNLISKFSSSTPCVINTYKNKIKAWYVWDAFYLQIFHNFYQVTHILEKTRIDHVYTL